MGRDAPSTANPGMVEAVAYAIAEAVIANGLVAKLQAGEPMTSPQVRELFMGVARQAISTLREPTEAMRTAGSSFVRHEGERSDEADDVYYAMINAALSESAQDGSSP